MSRTAMRSKRVRDNRRKRATNRDSPRVIPIIAFGAIAVAVLAMAAYFLWPVVRSVGPATAGATTVQLSMGGFNPSYIEARVGEPLTLHLVNKDNRFHTDGGGWHQFAIDELGVDVKVPPLETQEVRIVPIQAGTFEFYCDVCCGGRENPYMQGTLVVNG